jgi:hypothetical protein
VQNIKRIANIFFIKAHFFNLKISILEKVLPVIASLSVDRERIQSSDDYLFCFIELTMQIWSGKSGSSFWNEIADLLVRFGTF